MMNFIVEVLDKNNKPAVVYRCDSLVSLHDFISALIHGEMVREIKIRIEEEEEL